MAYLSKYYHFDVEENDEELHRDTNEETEFFHAVRNGDMDYVRENIETKRFMDSTGVGNLSRNPLVNLKYHMVISTAIITRVCIEKGLEPERAFRMSDFYIRKLDDAATIEQVELLHNQMVLDFTGKMRLLRKNGGTTRNITKCVNYIYTNINKKISVEELADYLGISAGYLSRQFVKEIGISISDYIREKKIEIAQELLVNTDDSISDIAFNLSFSSQSHFIQIFKNITGTTPKQYRSKNSVSTLFGGEV